VKKPPRIALIVALLTALAACGSSGDGDATVAAPEPEVAAAPEQSAQTDAPAEAASAPAPTAPAAGTTAPAPSAAAPSAQPTSPTEIVEKATKNLPGAKKSDGKSGKAGATSDVPRPPVLKVGGVFPLSGPLGSVGTAMMQGVQAVLTEVNAAGGVGGTKLELVVDDDQFDPVRGKALIQKQIDAGVFAFAGIFSPFTIQAALPVIRAAKVPAFPSGSDDREFDEPMLFPVTNPCGRQMAGNVQHLVREKKIKKLAVVYVNVEAVSNCAKYFTEVAKQMGAEVVFNGATAPAAPDCAGRIVAARASGAEALIVITENLGTVKCLQARAQQNWNVPVSISYNNTDDPTILGALGAKAEGMLSSSPFTGGSSAEFAKQCGAVKKYYPDAKVQFFMIVGCLGTKLLVEGLKISGADREGLIKALESGKKFDFGGLVPTLSYAPGRHLPYDLTATVEVKGGKWVRTGTLYTPEGPPLGGSGDATSVVEPSYAVPAGRTARTMARRRAVAR
jgi:branched-chain amino acid transport system substrate-binding protein